MHFEAFFCLWIANHSSTICWKMLFFLFLFIKLCVYLSQKSTDHTLVQFSRSVMSNPLQPHGLQHTRLSRPSPTPGVCSNSCPLVNDALQPSHPLSSPSAPAFNLSQHQGLFKESVLCIRWPKFRSFSCNISPSNEHPGLISSCLKKLKF